MQLSLLTENIYFKAMDGKKQVDLVLLDFARLLIKYHKNIFLIKLKDMVFKVTFLIG